VTENPYAPPTTETLTAMVPETEAEQIRKEYRNHEAQVKSIGLIYGLCAVLIMLASGLGLMSFLHHGDIVALLVGGFVFGIGLFQFCVAVGLSNLSQWTKVPVAIFSAIGLLAAPVGTLINGYILFLVFSEKGTYVFSDDYKQILEATPHIKQDMSTIIRPLLVLLFLIIGISAICLVADYLP